MFNIGLFELLVIFFFNSSYKTRRNPKVTKNIGLLYRKFNRYILNLKYEIDEIDLISTDSKVSKKE